MTKLLFIVMEGGDTHVSVQTGAFGSVWAPQLHGSWVVGACGSAGPSWGPRGRQRLERLPSADVLEEMFRRHHSRVTKFCGQDTDSPGLRRLCAAHASAGGSWVLWPLLEGPAQRGQDEPSHKDKTAGMR